MQIVFLTPHFAPHFEGGTETVARAQARELAARGHRVRILSGTDRPHAGEDVVVETVDGLEVRFLPRTPGEVYDLALERPRLEELLSRQIAGADIAHVHHWSTLHGALVRRLGRQVPVVLSLHDLFVTCPRFFRAPVAPVRACPEGEDAALCARCVSSDAPGHTLDQLARGVAARTQAFREELQAARARVVPSAAHGDRLAHLMGLSGNEFTVIPHGLSQGLGRAPVRRWGGEGPLRVLFLGNRARLKGVLDLVRALALLPPAERSRVELLFLGEEVEEGLDRELVRAGQGLRMEFAGPYTLGELPERLERAGGAHLLAFPSRAYESYGLVVDEGQALGLPVWVSDRGAPQERVGGAGWIGPVAAPAAWCATFHKILASPGELEAQRQALPERSRGAADAAQDLEDLYAQALDSSP